MEQTDKRLPRRLAIGFGIGMVLTTLLFSLLSTLLLPAEIQAIGSSPAAGCNLVTPAMAQAFGSVPLAALVQALLGGVFGAVVAIATLPFADDGRELVLRSLGHFAMTVLSFSTLLWVCRWVTRFRFILLWAALLAVLYVLIWLGRWIGWYMEVAQLRSLLGLTPGPSPLKWRETLPYLPYILLLCNLLPLVLRWLDHAVVGDVPVLSGLLLPYLLLPLVGFMSGVSLGKRQGVCPLYPLACFLLYLPMVFLLFNSSALFHCFTVAVPAAAGNMLGWLYRRAVPKHR